MKYCIFEGNKIVAIVANRQEAYNLRQTTYTGDKYRAGMFEKLSW